MNILNGYPLPMGKDIFLPTSKWVGCGYHRTRTYGQSLPVRLQKYPRIYIIKQRTLILIVIIDFCFYVLCFRKQVTIMKLLMREPLIIEDFCNLDLWNFIELCIFNLNLHSWDILILFIFKFIFIYASEILISCLILLYCFF